MTPPDVTLIAESRCLHCGRRLNALGNPTGGDERPEPGSVVICIRCGAVMMLDDRLQPRGMSDEEMDALVADREWMDETAKLVQKIYFLKASQS